MNTYSPSPQGAFVNGMGDVEIEGQQNKQGPSNKMFTLGHSLRNFFNNQLLSDVTFMIEQNKFYAHKLILAARSPYFFNLILVNCKNTNTLEVEIQDASADIFYNILEFVYTDSTVLKQDTVWDVYQGAKFYQLNNLLVLCQDFIVGSLNENNVFQFWKRSQDLNAINVAEHCVLFIRNRYEAMFKLGQINPNALTVSTNPEFVLQTLQQLAQQNNVSDATNTAKVEKDTEIYESLQTYSFPPPGGNQQLSGRLGSSQAPIPVKQESNMVTTTQTFELWNSKTTAPPAAFPTPESIAAYPKFFRVDPNQEDEDECEMERAKKKKRQGSQVLCRRLSVLKPDIVNPNSSTNPSGQVNQQEAPASVGVFLQHIISCVTRLLDAERTTLFMYDKSTDELCAQVSIGDPMVPSNDKSVPNSVYQSGRSINQLSDSNQKRSVICAPITITSRSNQRDQKVVGVLEVLNTMSRNQFSPLDESHLKTIANVLSIFLNEQIESYFTINLTDTLSDEEDAIKKILLNQVLLPPSAYRRTSNGRVGATPTGSEPLSQGNIQNRGNSVHRGSSFSISRSGSLGLGLSDDHFATIFDDIEDISDLLTEHHSSNNYQQQTSTSTFNFDNQSQVDVMGDYQMSGNEMTSTDFNCLPNTNQSVRNNNNFNKPTTNQPQTFAIPRTIQNSQQGSLFDGQPTSTTNTFNQRPLENTSDKKRKRGKEADSNVMNVLNQRMKGPQPDNMPFMHFRIPRYELQFIQFDGSNQGSPNALQGGFVASPGGKPK
ncbi:hypothetical protein AKO1_014682 [Acrasis kona]|uniref:BTB domain-containing protein n=1 Tax=Acrasis kona TaxID=1008807 RepID=A0AAW2Z249_9EUKA